MVRITKDITRDVIGFSLIAAGEIAKAKDRGGEIGILTPKQLADLLTASDEEAKLYFAIAAFTGLRSAELIRLEWEDVNFAREHIQVGKGKAKTATRRLVPIQPNLMQWLSEYHGRTELVFASEHAAYRAALTSHGETSHVKIDVSSLFTQPRGEVVRDCLRDDFAG